jgi:hypothetical protein
MKLNFRCPKNVFENYETAARFIRGAMGKTRVTTELKEEIEKSVEIHNKRKSYKINYCDLGIKHIIAKNGIKVQAIICNIWPFRKAESRWAGGNNYWKIKQGKYVSSSGKSERAWSLNGKWSGNDASFTVGVSYNWIKNVYESGIAVLNGKLTTHAKRIECDVPGIKLFEARWLSQSRGFGVNVHDGYIAVDSDNNSYHGVSVKSVVSQLKNKMAA